MRYTPDITVYDRNGDIVMLVEVKVKTGTDKAWAADTYRNLFAGPHRPQAARYFLLALPDRFYLWDNRPGIQKRLEPDWVIDPLPFLNPYYQRIGRGPGAYGQDSFKMIVSSWLNEILWADTPELLSGYESWLFDSGLAEALIGGKIGYEVSV